MRQGAKKNRNKRVARRNKPPITLPTPKQPPPTTQFSAQMAFHSGPIPPPEILEKYDQVLLGGAERIMAMAENQSAHRQKLEEKYLTAEARNSLLGIIFALFLGVTGLAASGICIYVGQGWPGAALGGATLVSLVGTFIYGTRQRRIEREQKFQIFAKNQ